MNQSRGSNFSLRVNKAIGDTTLQSFGDFTAIFGGYFACTEKIHLVCQVPYASSAKSETDTMRVYPAPYPTTYKSTMAVIGNPYVGVEIAEEWRTSRVIQFGVRIPNVSADNTPRLEAATIGGVISHEQFEAFAPELFTAQGAFGKQFYSQKPNYWFHAKVIGGVSVLKYTKADEELCVDFNPEIWFLRQKVECGFGLSSRLLLTEAGKDFSDRIESQLGFALNLVSGKVRPGAHLRIPMNGAVDSDIDFLIGGHVTLDLQ
jgi:hypothetical protein